jgi:hypothetical protein
MREEHKFMVFESRVLRIIFGFKKEEVKDKAVLPTPWRRMGGGSRGVLLSFLSLALCGGDRLMEE